MRRWNQRVNDKNEGEPYSMVERSERCDRQTSAGRKKAAVAMMRTKSLKHAWREGNEPTIPRAADRAMHPVNDGKDSCEPRSMSVWSNLYPDLDAPVLV